MKTKRKIENGRLRKIAEGDKLLFLQDDKVQWTYRHTLNRNSSTLITKYGLFVRYINSTHKDGGTRWDITAHCFVLFEGNKNSSKITIDEVELRDIN